MPRLNEIVKDRETKKFVKRSYRPWDLSGNDSEQIDDKQTNSISETSSTDDNPLLENKKDPLLPVLNNHIELDNDIDNIKVTIEEQLDNKEVTFEQQIDNIQETVRVTNKEHLDNKQVTTNLYSDLLCLTGIQKKIVECVADICSAGGRLNTGPVETNRICVYVNASRESIKTSINRLINKGILIRNKGKTARGGYIDLGMTEHILSMIITQREKNINRVDSSNISELIRKQLDNNAVYSSNSNLNNITTKKEAIPKEWELVDFELLSEIGFSKTQIKQLIGKNDPTIVQESINHFAYGLNHTKKFIKYEDPLNVLMGVLRKGQSWVEKDYRSEQEIAQLQYLENKKAELERKKIIEEDAFKLAFSEWQQNISPVESEKIILDSQHKGDIGPEKVKLSRYFKENIWPLKKSEYLITME